jgi:hypothetical protein
MLCLHTGVGLGLACWSWCCPSMETSTSTSGLAELGGSTRPGPGAATEDRRPWMPLLLSARTGLSWDAFACSPLLVVGCPMNAIRWPIDGAFAFMSILHTRTQNNRGSGSHPTPPHYLLLLPIFLSLGIATRVRKAYEIRTRASAGIS